MVCLLPRHLQKCNQARKSVALKLVLLELSVQSTSAASGKARLELFTFQEKKKSDVANKLTSKTLLLFYC